MEALAPPSVVFHLSCLEAWRASSLEVRRFLKWMPASCRAVRSLPSVASSVARAPANSGKLDCSADWRACSAAVRTAGSAPSPGRNGEEGEGRGGGVSHGRGHLEEEEDGREQKTKTPPIRRPRSSPPAFAAQTETGRAPSAATHPIRSEPIRSEPGKGGADRPRGRGRRREGRGGEGASHVKRSRREGSGGGRGEKRSGRGAVPRKASRLRAGNGGTGTNLQAAPPVPEPPKPPATRAAAPAPP